MFASFTLFVTPIQTWKVGKKDGIVSILQVKESRLEAVKSPD